jgi:hypothetical protein
MSELGTMAALFSLTGSEIISDQRLKQAKLRHERGVNEGIPLKEQFSSYIKVQQCHQRNHAPELTCRYPTLSVRASIRNQ